MRSFRLLGLLLVMVVVCVVFLFVLVGLAVVGIDVFNRVVIKLKVK